jgi:outer membrane autotransporter protein
MPALIHRFPIVLVPALALASVLPADRAAAFSNGWTGAVSSDWQDPGNWSDDIVPHSARRIWIGTITPHAPILSGGSAATGSFGVTQSGRLRIENGAELLSTGPVYVHSPDTGQDDPGVRLSGAGTIWRTPYYLGIGRSDHAGSVIVTDGARLETNWFHVAPYHSPERSYLRLSGAGTSLASTFGGMVGTYNPGTMIVADDAHVDAGEASTLFLGDNHALGEGTIVIGSLPGQAPVGPGRITAQRILASGDHAWTVFNHDGSGYRFDTPLEGTARIAHMSGETIITAPNPQLTARTDVTGGTLRVDGGLRGTLDIRDGARLSGSGVVGQTHLHAGATVAPGNSIGTLSIEGDATFAPGSRFEVTIDPASGDHDRLAISGQAVINGGEVLHVGRAETAGTRYRPFASYRILTAENGVIGQFDGVGSAFAFLDAELAYAGNAVDLIIRRNDLAFSSLATTPNQGNVARALEDQDFDAPLYQAMLGLDAEGARDAFSALSGEQHAGAMARLTQNTAAIRAVLAKRFRMAFDGGLVADGRGGAEPAAAYASLPTGLPQFTSPRAALWAKGFGQHGRINAGGREQFTSGLLAGADMPLKGMPGDVQAASWHVGMLGGLGTSRLHDPGGLVLRSRDLYLGAYAGRRHGDFNLNLGMTGSRHAARSERNVSFPGFNEGLHARFIGYGYQFFGEAGYRLHADRVTVEPIIGLAHTGMVTQPIRESGGAAALTVARAHHHETRSLLGTRLMTQFGMARGEARLHMMAGWQRRLAGHAPPQRMRFAEGPAFTVAGDAQPAEAFVGEAGIDFVFDGGTRLGLSLEGARDAKGYLLGANLDMRVAF